MTLQISVALACGTLILLAPAALPRQIPRPDSKIVEQADAPVLVTAYRTEYQKRTADTSEGIRHFVEYRNRSARKVVAVQFGLVVFDIWNEFLDRTAGLSTEPVAPRARENGTWLTPNTSAFAFHTGVVYVDRIRYDTGEIWLADADIVLGAMRAIQKDFDPANLAKKAKD